MNPISVSTLNEQIKSLLETTFCNIYVEGEVSNLTYHNSGHIYFNIKDDNSTISCVMFRGNARYLKFRLENGQKINVSGSITAYVPRGTYQILCTKIEPSGTGALALAYEQLKTKLQIKGYFDIKIKKQLPKFPNTIYVVTSNTGAAIEDMKKVLSHRYPLAKMVLIPALVQGSGSKESIVRAIKKADLIACNSSLSSLIIVGRGGGSIEDLWSFNEEVVADAIYEAKTPIVSAVGHESDFVISDFVADVRASTPSNAIEISTPDINEYRLYLDNISNDFSLKYSQVLNQKQLTLNHLKQSFEQHSIDKKFSFVQSSIDNTKLQLNQSFNQILKLKQEKINSLKTFIESNHPSKKDKSGFVQLTKDGSIIDISKLEENDKILLESSSYKVNCKVLSKSKI